MTDASGEEVELLDASETTVPDEPAGPVSVTVPIEALPPLTEAGLKETEDKLAGVIDNEADFPPAEIVAAVAAFTPVVLMVKVPVKAPAATIIVEGTEALLLSEDTLTE